MNGTGEQKWVAPPILSYVRKKMLAQAMALLVNMTNAQ